MDAFLVINPRSGDQRPTADELRIEAEARGIRTHVLARGEDAAQIARSADAAIVGVAGGDGSLGAVAGAALERGVPFLCVPFGTRNHFARDLGLDPDDPVAALAAVRGVERRVDAGRVNGRVFLNNVSLGLYARLVHEREGRERRRQALATLRALLLVLRNPRPVRLAIDGEPAAARIVLAANNAYRLELFTLGERERLDEGLLHLYEAPGLLPRNWAARAGSRFRIDSRRGPLRAAVDGEPVRLDPPVELVAEPAALRVLVPREPG